MRGAGNKGGRSCKSGKLACVSQQLMCMQLFPALSVGGYMDQAKTLKVTG